MIGQTDRDYNFINIDIHNFKVGTRVVHTFHVVNDGPWPAHSTIVNIDWPFQV